MGYRIQNRRDTAARWAEMNPILLEGEMGIVLDDPNQYKIGDGVHTWNELPLRGFTGTIAQTLGNNENAVASQKVVTEKFAEQDEKLSDIGSEVGNIDIRATQIINQIPTLDLENGSYDSESGLPYNIGTRIRTTLTSVDLVRKVRVSDSYQIIQAFYYRNDVNSISRVVTVSSNEYDVTPNENEKYVALNFAKSDKNLPIEPSENIGLLVNESIKENIDSVARDITKLIADEQPYLNQSISNLGLLHIERGSYDPDKGTPYGIDTRLRTQLLSVDYIDSIAVADNYKIVQAFYYNGNDTNLFSRRVDVVSNSYNFKARDNESFVAITFRKNDGNESIIASENLGIVSNGGVFQSIKKIKKELKDGLYQVDIVEFELGGFYSINDGNLLSSNGYASSKKMDISGVLYIKYNMRAQGNASGISFFDKGDNFIGGLSANYGEDVVLTSENIPQDAKYAAFSKSTSDAYKDGYAEILRYRANTNNDNKIAFSRYMGRKMCTIGSSSTEPGEWQKHLCEWIGFEFDKDENQQGKGYVRIESADSYWLGVEYSETLPENTTQGLMSMSGTEVTIWTDANGNIWRKAFQTSKGGDYIKANNSLNIFARAFDVKWYNPKVVFLMCYNEINYISTEQPYGSLGTIDDEPVFSPNTSASIYASYKGLIEYITKNVPMCEIVLVSTKLNSYAVYKEEASTIADIRNSERYKKDKIYHDAVKEIAEYYGVKFVDLFENTGQTPWSIVDYMQGLTNVHCNSKGQLEYIASNIYKGFMS